MSVISELSKDELQRLCDASHSYADILQKLGLRIQGAHYRSLRKRLEELEVSQSVLDLNRKGFMKSHIQRLKRESSTPLEDMLVVKRGVNRASLKKKLIQEGKLLEECAVCNQKPYWKGKKLVLVLDHINGVYYDNRLENLRLLCPNCNSQTDTFCGKKNKTLFDGSKPEYRCKACNKVKKTRESDRCVPCTQNVPRKKKIRWPEPTELMALLEESNYSQLGRRLGVSDKAIKKHIKVLRKRGALPLS